jgi:hypothetical protein
LNRTPASLARDWVVANFIALLVIAACGLAGYFARTVLGADSLVRAGTMAAYMTIETVLAFVSFGAYANLTGRVLQRVLPRFPWRDWVAVHLAMGLVVGPCIALLMAEPGEPEPIDWSDTGLVVLIFTAGPAVAALLGAAIGGLQAVVLKRVARGMLRWIGFSALSVGMMLTAVLPVLLAMPQRTLGSEIIQEGALVVAGVLAAIVMLPALRRLQPVVGGA